MWEEIDNKYFGQFNEREQNKGGFYVFQDQNDKHDIHFKLNANAVSPIPEDQLSLKEEIEKTLVVLKVLFENDESRFYTYFNPLLSLAQTGLVGESPQPEIALRALNTLKNEITAREGGIVKNHIRKSKSTLRFSPSPRSLIPLCHSESSSSHRAELNR